MKRIGTYVLLAALVLALAVFSASCGKKGKKAWAPDVRNANADATAIAAGTDLGTFKVLWKIPVAGLVTGKPLIKPGVLYIADWSGAVTALSPGSGMIIWSKTIQTVSPMWSWRGFSGTGAMSEDMLFEASAEGNIYGIDPKNGEVKWQNGLSDKPYAGNTGALLYWDGVVYAGVSSMSEGLDQQEGFTTDFQGSVQAFETLKGKLLWEFKTVDGAGNGAAVWSGFALDPEANILYFTTGNNYTGEATAMSDAIVAVDAKTGQKKWSKQCTAGDVWTMAQPKGPDYDFGAPPQLVDVTANGAVKKLVIAGQKSGVLWALDRLTGDVVWTDTLGKGGVAGGFMAPASIEDGGIYAWSNNDFAYTAPDSHMVDVAAFDPGSGRAIWRKNQAQPACLTGSGFAAGGFYFVGSLDGMIRAYNTKDGALAWTSEKMGAISTPIVAFNGRLYFGSGIPEMFGGDGSNGAIHCVGPAKK